MTDTTGPGVPYGAATLERKGNKKQSDKQGIAQGPIPTTAAVALRDYQQGIADDIARATRNYRAIMATAPTGGGKTTIAADLARRMALAGKRIWFLVHRKELLTQAQARFLRFGLPTGIIAAGTEPNPDCVVQVCMVQTLCNRLAEIPEDQHPDFIFVDEAHRATANQYSKAFAPFPKAKIIGLSATPERADGTGLGDTFDVLLQPVTTWDLIRRGFLVQPLYYVAEVDLAGLNTKGADYDEAELFERFNKPRLYSHVVEKWQAHGRGYRTLVFCINVAHSQATAAAFVEAGISATHVDGDTPIRQREQILADFAAGKYLVLCNVGLLGEGYDLPAVGCVVMNRATKSRPLWFQCIGRAARPTAGFDAATDAERVAAVAASDKPRAIVIDHGQNLKTHGWWEQPITYTLDAPKKKTRKKGAALDVFPIRECPKCGAYTHATARVCVDEGCGYVYPSIVDRAVNAAFVETEFDGSHLLPPPLPEPTPKPKPIDLWPVRLRPFYRRPALMPHADRLLVEKLAGYKKGWADLHQKRAAKFQKGGQPC